MSEPVPHHFKCIDLTKDNAQITDLDVCLSKINKGFHSFYTHEGLITGIQNSVEGSPELLKKVFEPYHSIKNLLVQDDMQAKLFGELSSCPLVLIPILSTSKLNVITTFFQTLREILSDNSNSENSNFLESSGFSLNQAISWDLCLEREKYSGLIPGVNNYHEYLLWDDLSCLNKDSLHDQDVWTGAGWINSRLHKHIKQSSDKWQLDKLGEWCNSVHDQLSRSLDNLTAFVSQNQDINPYNLESHNNFIRALCEFLPYHRSSTNPDKFIPSNSLGERGGPMLWRGLLDDRMHLRRRHLLMDGWLTLWPSEQDGETKLYVQPGSLALLYWAARKVDMPYTDTPEYFLENYQWDYNPHWFGGMWNRSRGKING